MGEIHDIGEALTRTAGFSLLNPTEKDKCFAELAGEIRTKCTSLLGQQIVRLARMDPPNVTTPPPPTSAIDPLWKRDGVFVRSLSSFHGTLRDAAKAAGFSCIYVQLDHSADVAGNINEIALIGATLRAKGWKLAGWSTYGQGTDPSADGARHAQIRRSLDVDLDGWVANGESWAEGAESWKSGAWLEAWRQAGGFGPLAVSCLSSDNPNFARDFAYSPWLAVPGCAVMPQVYGASFPAYTVNNCLATMTNGGVPRDRLAMTFDVIGGVGPFANYKTWTGPRSIWTGDDSTVETWAALAR